MRALIAAVCVGTAVSLVAQTAQGIGISAKMKSKKVQADLVPAYYPASTGSGTGDDEGDDPAILGTPVQRGKCTFESGKVQVQAGKDDKIQLKGVNCNGTPYSGSLCAHRKVLSTIMDEDIDKKGVSTPKVCVTPDGASTSENTISFTTGAIGLISCSNGKCKGTLPPVTADPCPDVDKVSQVTRVEVFDGPEEGVLQIAGAAIGACCGPNQNAAGPIPVSPFCPVGSTQDVFAEMGYVTQGVTPK
jgi:hypothetical protein